MPELCPIKATWVLPNGVSFQVPALCFDFKWNVRVMELHFCAHKCTLLSLVHDGCTKMYYCNSYMVYSQLVHRWIIGAQTYEQARVEGVRWALNLVLKVFMVVNENGHIEQTRG